MRQSPSPGPTTNASEADLASCEREPIHVPGAIQPHGCLLICAVPTWTIETVSANAGAFFGGEAARLLGQPLDDVLPGKAVHDLRNVLQASLVSGSAERLSSVPIGEGAARHDLTMHMNGIGAVIEIVPCAGTDTMTTDPVVLVKSMMARLKRAADLGRFLKLAALQVRAVTGFDRVMIYKFLEDGSGQVVAEALRSGLTPFLGLRYPASDIPAQARALYKKQWLRAIPDVVYEPVPLLSHRGDIAAEADLSLATLRSASPVHLEYLRNMGSRATLTVSILAGDDLLGLIACHHEAPRRISSSTSAAAEIFGQILSLQVEAKEQAEEFRYSAGSREVHDRLIASMAPDASIFDDLERYADLLKALIPCDGVGVWSAKGFAGVGATPPPGGIPELVAFLSGRTGTEPFATNALAAALPAASDYARTVSGMLAIPFSRSPRVFLLFFRRELLQTVTWGGNPHNAVEVTDGGHRIGPRKSFEAWSETVRQQSSPWRPAELTIAETLRVSLLDVILRRADLLEHERRAAQESQAILIAELNHRVKNILALIRSLVRQSRQGARTVDGFARDVEQRISALALAHDQLMQTHGQQAPLRPLLEAEVRAWADSPGRVALNGPPVLLDSRAFQTLALVFHEMMTNAVKYGSLSRPEGRLAVAWQRGDGGGLRIEWRETGGPPVIAPERRGFGTVIVEQIVRFELGGESRVDYRPDGVYGLFLVPRAHVAEQSADDAEVRSEDVQPHVDLVAGRLLLVEDSMMIALDAQAMLGDAGLEVEVAGTVADARRLIQIGAFDAAVLDINLSGERSFELADDLRAMGTPFVFATGYGQSIVTPDRFRAVPVVSKPYDGTAIKTALGSIQGIAHGSAEPREDHR